MTVERGVRLLAGTMILISLALTRWVSPYWLLLTLFVADNGVPPALVALVVRVPGPKSAGPLPGLFVQRTCAVTRDQAAHASVIAPVTLVEPGQRAGVLGIVVRLSLLWLQRGLAA